MNKKSTPGTGHVSQNMTSLQTSGWVALTLRISVLFSDVNECTENLAFCDHDCTNKPGSYECSCYPGYDLYTTPGFGDLELGSGEDGSKPWHNFHINHSCVCKFVKNEIVS